MLLNKVAYTLRLDRPSSKRFLVLLCPTPISINAAEHQVPCRHHVIVTLTRTPHALVHGTSESHVPFGSREGFRLIRIFIRHAVSVADVDWIIRF